MRSVEIQTVTLDHVRVRVRDRVRVRVRGGQLSVRQAIHPRPEVIARSFSFLYPPLR